MSKKKKSIWKNMGLALAATPVVSFIGLVVITLVGAVDDAITRIQVVGRWWVILIVAYILSLAYFLCKPVICQNHEREKIINALILYWKERLERQGKSQPSDPEIEIARGMLLERVKIWAWFDSGLWGRYFPNEKYSKYLFDVADNFIVYWENQKNKFAKK